MMLTSVALPEQNPDAVAKREAAGAMTEWVNQ